MTQPERLRFAPSPTGHLHIGNARTALFNFLYARKHEGVLVLRIEDTDMERSVPLYEESLIDALHWLHIGWEEGPDRGGPHGPYRQSERQEWYKEYSRWLLDEGRAFLCYCTEQELQTYRGSMLRDGKAPRYPGKCRELTAKQRQDAERKGRVPCVRYRVPADREIQFDDAIHGPMAFRSEEIGDFVLMRSTGIPTYNFSAVIDDRLMGITTVIRGEDHLPNTPRQLLLFQEFGWEPPRFAHHALLTGPDRTKLSKRYGVTSVEAFREMGILPEALVNYLAILGGPPVAGQEVFSLPDLIESFSIEKAGRSSVVFDQQKLMWLNQQHLRLLAPGRQIEAMLPFLEEAGCRVSDHPRDWLEKFAGLIAENIQRLQDIHIFAPIFFRPMVDYAPSVQELLRDEKVRGIIGAVHARLRASPPSGEEGIADAMRRVQRDLGLTQKEFSMPVRLAVTGMDHGPELDRILPLLSLETIRRRLEASLVLS